jgi:predicted O-methyltransferase YrrM
MFDAKRIASIKSLQRPGEADALYTVALKAPRGKAIVELGTFHGYTAAVLAMAGEQIGAHVTTIDDYVDRPEQHLPAHIGPHAVGRNLAQADLDIFTTVRVGDTRIVPASITEVGMLWIDSTHTAAHVTAELAAWLPLVIVGGIVAFHDYGGASTPQLKAPIDKTFADRRRWQNVGGYHTVIAFKRLR